MKFRRILAAVAATPWAIEPSKGRELARILSDRSAGKKATKAELAAAAGARAERDSRKRKPTPGGMALIPLYGVMTQRSDLFMEVSGLLSTEQVGRMVDQAAADASIDAIILDVDSPGGSVFGTPELAAKVAAASQKKKVTAVCNSMCASAAFFVASQASELVITPGGMCGSLGVVMMHIDESKALEMNGQVVTVIASSEKKAGGVDPGPLSPAWRAELEGIVAGYYDDFIRAVAKGRNVSQRDVRENFGQGGVLLARQAVAVGMCDRIASLDDVLAEHGLRFSADGESLIATAAVSRLAPTARRVFSRDPETARRQRVMAEEEERDRLKVETERRRKQMAEDDRREKTRAENEARRALMARDEIQPVRPAVDRPAVSARLWRMAYHEAAHAAVAYLLGDTQVSADIIPTSERGGACYWSGSASPENAAAILLAGKIGEELCPHEAEPGAMAFSDSVDLKLAAGFVLDWQIPECRAKARNHVYRCWHQIHQLAALLVERRAVSAADVASVFAACAAH